MVNCSSYLGDAGPEAQDRRHGGGDRHLANPTDSGLLNDGVRVLGSAHGQGQGDPRSATGEGEFRNRSRSAKRLARSIAQGARRRDEGAKEATQGCLRAAHRRRPGQPEAGQRGAPNAAKASGGGAPPGREAGRGARTPRRAGRAGGGADRAAGSKEARASRTGEKLVSLFEEHTAIIARGKAAKKTEFGRKVWLEEVEGGIVNGLPGARRQPLRREQLLPSLENHLRLFERPPRLVAADRGVYSPVNEEAALKIGVERVALPKKGAKKREKRRGYERQGWFRAGTKVSGGDRGAHAGKVWRRPSNARRPIESTGDPSTGGRRLA